MRAFLLCAALFSYRAFEPEAQKAILKISCPSFRPRPIKIVRQAYPALAKQTHVEGKVSLYCIVGPDGLVKRLEVKKSHPLLIQAATDAVSQWKFTPMVVNGKAVETATTVDIDFQLPKNEKRTETKSQ